MSNDVRGDYTIADMTSPECWTCMFQTASKGILYGTGRQVYGAVLLFISYYVLALPIGIPLMFLTWLRSAGTFHIVTQSKI